jgi:hypothetical protein
MLKALYYRALTGECFLSPRRVAMATMIDGESFYEGLFVKRFLALSLFHLSLPMNSHL